MSLEKPQQPSGPPNFNELEKNILKFWENNNIFEKSLEQTKAGQPYIFYDGPPFATGLPHYGHILGSAVKDFYGRYQTMQGRFVRRRWGWDCHGLPIENIVEQQLKISGKKQIEEFGVEKFNQACRDNVLKFAEEWGKMVSRMGRWVDFTTSYKTMDTTYQESVWWSLKQTWNKGLIYEDRKVLLYCSRCETPISNFEVAMDNSYKEVNEESVYAKFKLHRGRIKDHLINDKTFALAWTTTPWTLPGNTSLNVGPDIVYVMIEMENKERYILAKERLAVINEPYELVAEFPAREMEGLSYEPLYPGVIVDPNNRAHKIYLADFVTTTDGTGIVHNAAMYGEEDYQLAKEKNLPRIDMLDHQGKYLPMAPEHLRGLFFKKGDKIILQELTAQGKVYKTENYLHSYPHCYRCGTPLFYNAIPAWFINIQKIKSELRKINAEEINWYPEHLKNGRFDKSIESAPDWNISRNRYWATALPFWKCENKECKNVLCIGSVGELKEKAVNFYQVYPNFDPANLNLTDLHRPYIDKIKLKCEKCGGEMQRVPEVVDCWVESGSMPFAELHFPFENQELFKQRFPADFVAEYIGQVRAWYYVMLVVSAVNFEHAPFKNVVTTGNILAEDGNKMSKSKNNFPDPWVVIEQYGIDAVRFYLLTAPVMNGDDLNFTEKGVAEINRKVGLILYNVWSFWRMYEKGVVKDNLDAATQTHILDKWLLARLAKTSGEVTAQLNSYNTVKAGKEILEFINDFSTWYVRRNRDRIKENSPSSQAALGVLGFALIQTAKMLAPFMPFMSDFIYKDVTGEESVHLSKWTNLSSLQVEPNIIEKMEIVREAVTVGLALRKEKSLPVRQPLAGAAFATKQTELQLDADLQQLILDELNVKKINPELLNKDYTGIVLAPGVKNIANFYLDTNMTSELKAEGVARELERTVQDLRKKSSLKVGDLVDLYYNTLDEGLEDSLLKLFDRKKTFVSQITKSLEVEVDYEIQAQVDGKAIWFGFVKI